MTNKNIKITDKIYNDCNDFFNKYSKDNGEQWNSLNKKEQIRVLETFYTIAKKHLNNK
jgi:hypothetical protein